jgi:peroxiredoxin Q/BCP
MIETGSHVPDFTLQGLDAEGNTKEYRLSDLLKDGKKVVLFAYPKDNTPGCTTEACDFRDRAPAASDRAVVLGISADSMDSHRKFQTQHGLTFPLLSDPDKTLLTALGAWGEKKNYGKTYMGIIRSTFVINPDGTLASAYRNVKVAGHAEKVLRAL